MLKCIPITSDGYVPSTTKHYFNCYRRLCINPIQVLHTQTAKVRSMDIPDIKYKPISPWTSTEIPPKNYGEDACTVSTKTIKVIDFYVDSVAIENMTMGIFTSGDGTEDNPFRCVSYALHILNCVFDNVVAAMCDVYIVLHIKGHLDYFDVDIREKLPETSAFIPYNVDTDSDFFKHLIYDFDTCEINLSVNKGDTFRFTPMLHSFLCLNMHGDIAIPGGGSIFACKMLCDCDIEVHGNSVSLDIGNYLGWYYNNMSCIYNTSLNLLNTDIGCSSVLVASNINISNGSIASGYVDYNAQPFTAYKSNFKINGGCYIYGAYACNIEHSVTNGYAALYSFAMNSAITVTDNHEYIDADNVYVDIDYSVNTKITATASKMQVYYCNNITLTNTISDSTTRIGDLVGTSVLYNSDITLNVTLPLLDGPDDDYYSWPHITCYGISSISPYLNDTFIINAKWLGNAKSHAIGMYGMRGSGTLIDCTYKCNYTLPTDFYYFDAIALIDSVNIHGGSVWKGTCVSGSGEREWLAECKANCIASGHKDCDERCKPYCERYKDDD